ncbi:MAG: ABC transporter ATP-binding protein [Proteobacteria bacterium]|jgi:ATP-binding cassette subfamily B protein|nr:ABC transporter ATP-binding protein [Pseudomonadota bacterium]MDA1299474.1 ABC transporter ATP-binding protein [Pseudomonadota bacterium]
MSETANELVFNDRIDTDTQISSAEAMVLLGRSFALLRHVKGLFAGKFLFALVGILPPLLIPWTGKIVVDQVLLQKPFGESEVRFPPFMDPLIAILEGNTPLAIMGTILTIYAVLLVLFGVRAGGAVTSGLTQGHDSATQSELALSAGSSQSSGIFGVIELMINIRLTQRLANTLRTELFRKLARLPMTTLDDNRIGDSVYRIMYDTPLVPEICFNLSIAPLFAVLGAMISLYLMQYSYGPVAPELVWIAAGLIPLALILTVPLSGFSRRLNQASRASGAATTNTMEESLENISAVQSLGGSRHERERFARDSDQSFKRFRFSFLFGQAMFVVSMFCTVVAGIYVAILVSDLIIGGTMTPGDYAVLFGLYLQLGGTALGIGMYWINLQTNVAAVRRVFFFIDYPSETPGDIHSRLTVQDTIRLDHVSYHYPDGRQALTDIDLEFRVGELTAIVGPTGAGKTSLAYLLPAFLRPSEGRILFDGIDIADVGVDAIRDQVAYVFQEHMLLSESIRSNLLLANPTASENDLRWAIDTAGAGQFVDSLPQGIDTVMGRRGDKLSVGQKQRICIARGLVRDTPVLVLDEPTAALDPETENALVTSLQKAAAGKLVIVIAHRLSTIKRADRIVFLDNGRVRAIGSHETLMADTDGPYRRYVELQTG